MKPSPSTVALFLGAGFSKPWGLPLTSELMDFDAARAHHFPGVWQQKAIARIASLWEKQHSSHRGNVDEFGKLLRGTPQFDPFVRYVALRLSSRLWHVGSAQVTKWGTGDHVARRSRIPLAYAELIKVLAPTALVGIVTTNYDIVVEKLLGPRARGRLGGFNYGTAGETLKGTHFTSSRGSYGRIRVTGCVPLAKVHGSLNWELSDRETFIRYVDCRPSRGRRYRVALFMPGDSHPAFAAVRELATSILSNADVWLMIGYSVPDDDEDVRQLLRTSSSRVALVCVSDPRSLSIASRLRALIGGGGRHVAIQALPELGSDELPTRLRDLLPLIPVRGRPNPALQPTAAGAIMGGRG